MTSRIHTACMYGLTGVYFDSLDPGPLVACERLEIIKFVLERGAQEEVADLDPRVHHQTAVQRPLIRVRVVMAFTIFIT
jgi:hypothetical protein